MKVTIRQVLNLPCYSWKSTSNNKTTAHSFTCFHMLQLYSLRMRFFQAPRDLLGQRKCTFVGWVGGSGKRGEESGACKAGVSGGGGVRRPSVMIGSEFFSIKVLYFILFSYSSFLFLFFLSFSLLCIIVFFFLGAIYFYNDSVCCISEVWINSRVCVFLVCYTAVLSVVTQRCSLLVGRTVAWRT